MRKAACKYVFLMLTSTSLAIAFCFIPLMGLAGTNIALPFSSTFNCAGDWTETYGQSCEDIAVCPGWQQAGAAPSTGGSWDKINATYNNPSGGGGRGFGHPVCDGVNCNGGSIRLTFAPQKELYIRFYMKYPLGFRWAGAKGALDEYQKIWYTNPQDSDQRLLVFQFKYADEIGYWLVNTTGGNADVSGHGWTTIMGGPTGDGKWHCYESHIKTGNPGVLQTWVDGVLVQNNTSANVGVHSGWTVLELMTNQASPANGGDVYVSLDDFAIQTTGPIGCLPGDSGGAPTSPTGLVVVN